jgi:hypothetical protein
VFRVPGIDWANTFCNHPLETAEVLGVFVLRVVLISEDREAFSVLFCLSVFLSFLLSSSSYYAISHLQASKRAGK